MRNDHLLPDQVLQTVHSRLTCIAGERLGGGGQGSVYRCRIDGVEAALKWYSDDYHLRIDPGVRARLETAYRLGAPAANFLWPFELVSHRDGSGLGYVMPLRPARFREMQELMRDEVQTSFVALAKLGFHLADSMLKLHAKGLCYQDINFGNLFFDPETGEACICDNDNVDIDGSPSQMAGTFGFQAPEIVRGEAYPRIQTDLHALAVLLFLVLMVQHPLVGRRATQFEAWDQQAQFTLYGSDPLFIFDPGNDQNATLPDDTALRYWPIYPRFLRELFIRSFTLGLHDPVNGRVRESEWRQAMSRLRDCVHPCRHCDAENFYDQSALADGGLPPCWSCGAPQAPAARVRIGNSIVMLYPGAELYPHHVGHSDCDFSRACARVAVGDAGDLQLVNCGSAAWRPSGSDIEIGAGQSIPIRHGMRVHFLFEQGSGKGLVSGDFRVDP